MNYAINHKTRIIHGIPHGTRTHCGLSIYIGDIEYLNDEKFGEYIDAGYNLCRTCKKILAKYPPSCNTFDEEKYNAMYDALTDAAANWCRDYSLPDTSNGGHWSVYLFMENCERSEFVVSLVDALENRGYFIGS